MKPIKIINLENLKVSSGEIDIVPSNYAAMANISGYTASYAANVTTLTIPISTAGRASSASTKSGDFIVELEVTATPYDFFLYLATTQATADTPAGNVAGIEVYDGYFYDKSGTGLFKIFDPTIKLYLHRVGTNIDIYDGPTFQSALYRYSIPCPAGALYVNFSAPGYASYNGSAKISLFDVVIPAAYANLTLTPHKAIGSALEKKAATEYPSMNTGLQVMKNNSSLTENFNVNTLNTGPFRIFASSASRGKWTIGDLSTNLSTRVMLSVGTYSGGTYTGFEFNQTPYVGTNVVYHASGTDVAIVDGGTGASTAADARTNLGLGTTDSPQFQAINLGHLNDTTLTRPNPGEMAIEGSVVLTEGNAATMADIRSYTGNRAITPTGILNASGAVVLTDAATVAVDWSSGVFWNLTMAGNRVLGNPTNGRAGTTRAIYLLGNDATARTLTFGTNFKGSIPTITDATSTKGYLLTVFCITSAHFVVTSVQAL